MLKKIISGGQTGADRAGLDVAIELALPYGGWIPKGRRAEDGRVPVKYDLEEMLTFSYPARTNKNIEESDGTVVFSRGRLTGGSAMTMRAALKFTKPALYIDLDIYEGFTVEAAAIICCWIIEYRINVLNVAGSRTSKDPFVYQQTKDILKSAVMRLLSEVRLA